MLARHLCACFLFLWACHRAAARCIVCPRKQAETRWCAVHAAANAVVAALTWRHVASADTRDELEAKFPITLTVAVHVYHALFYELSASDLAHHAIFIPTIAVPGVLYDWQNLGNAQLFFMCGLPGALLYTVVVARRVAPGTRAYLPEARISAAVNVGMRAPGVFLAAWRLWMACTGGTLPGVPLLCVAAQLVLAPANASYYAYEAIARARR